MVTAHFLLLFQAEEDGSRFTPHPDRNDDSNFLSFQMSMRIQRLARVKADIRGIVYHE